mgnify:CR=1 FL=1
MNVVLLVGAAAFQPLTPSLRVRPSQPACPTVCMQSTEEADELRRLIKQKENMADTLLVPRPELSDEINALRDQMEQMEVDLRDAGVVRYSAVGRMRQAQESGGASNSKDFFSELPQTSKNVALVGRTLLGGMALAVLAFAVYSKVG